MSEDGTLLVRALKGDRAAFATLYDRHSSSVFGYAVRLTGDRTAAEDVTQETFVALLGGKRFDPARSFTAWLLTIARNEAFDLMRRRKVRKEVGIGDLEREAAPGTDVGAREAVEVALRAIPDEYREAVWLCDGIEMSYQEAAEVMGCEVGTVGSRVARGRQLLKEQFSRSGYAV
ncbi:MAG: RNA polymerase sigma factor [Planctomycetes bacterium]|nr:RNA polymerase sigma factor [Planctomycetota bacterium]